METTIIKSEIEQPTFVRNPLLNLFQKDVKRDLIYADVVGYQLDLSTVIDEYNRQNPGEDNDLLPSWSKLSKSPTKAKGWYTMMLQAMFKGQYGGKLDNVNKDLQLEETGNVTEKPSVSMMFFSHSTSNASMKKLTKITEDALPEYAIISVYGGAKFKSGKSVENKTAEKYVREEIEKARANDSNKNIIILASQMAQRSFSEGLIDEIYLAYDNGAEGATIQKMARALTGDGTTNKKAKIFSLSFDPNRDDKIQCLVFQSAINMMEKAGSKNPVPFVKSVLSSLDIWSCQSNGSQIKWDATHYVENVLSKKVASRVLGQQIQVDKLTNSEMHILCQTNLKAAKLAASKIAERGKTHESTNTYNQSDNLPKTENLEGKAKEALIAILERSWYFMEFGHGLGCTNITETISKIEELELTNIFEESFEVPFNLIKTIFLQDIIQRNHVNLINNSK
jgi:hypothetical protein